jgi:hypothetical protein
MPETLGRYRVMTSAGLPATELLDILAATGT